MTRLADTVAAERAQEAWLGIDAPGAVDLVGIQLALERGLPGDVTLHDVAEWTNPSLRAAYDAGDAVTFTARFLGAISAALILGARLQETQGT